MAIGADQNVGRLQIAVDEAACVDERQRHAQLLDESEELERPIPDGTSGAVGGSMAHESDRVTADESLEM